MSSHAAAAAAVKASSRSQITRKPGSASATSAFKKERLKGRKEQTKTFSVTTALTSFLNLSLINKEPAGVTAQERPEAIFQLVSPERQRGILQSGLGEKRGG